MKFSKEEEYLRKKDKKLKKIIDENGHITFRPVKKNQFDTLVGIVISQFISTKAANSIFKSIRENFNSEYLNENHFKYLNVDQIKRLGLSTNKAKTIIHDQMSEAEKQLKSSGVAVKKVELLGDPKVELASMIAEQNFDLLAIGAYGHSKVRSFILGSTTSRLIQTVKVPVLLIR